MFLELRFNFVSRWLTLEGRLSKKNPLETRLHLLYIEISNKFYKDEKRFKTDKSTKGKFKKIEIVASLDYHVFNCFNWYWKFMNFRDTFGNKEVLVIFLKISWHFFFIRRTIAWKGKLKLGHVFYYTLSKILIYSFFFLLIYFWCVERFGIIIICTITKREKQPWTSATFSKVAG